MTPTPKTAGQQVLPSVNMGQWFNQRRTNMLQGAPSNKDEVISFVPGGTHWGKPGLYSSQTANIAPTTSDDAAKAPQPNAAPACHLRGHPATRHGLARDHLATVRRAGAGGVRQPAVAAVPLAARQHDRRLPRPRRHRGDAGRQVRDVGWLRSGPRGTPPPPGPVKLTDEIKRLVNNSLDDNCPIVLGYMGQHAGPAPAHLTTIGEGQ